MRIAGILHEDQYIYVHLWYLTEFFLEWGILQTEVVEKSEKFYAQSIFFWKCAIYEIMWKYMFEPNRP